jgi:hypothetical protein
MTQRGRPTRLGFAHGLAGAGAVLALAAGGAQVAAARAHTEPLPAWVARIPARAARSLSVDDNGELRLVHASGEILSEAGRVSGTLPGTASVRLDVGGTTITAAFVIRVRGGGSILGSGRAKLTSGGRYSSFGGTLSVTAGTGRYAHAHGAGKLYGTIERKSDDLTVQTREGTLYY